MTSVINNLQTIKGHTSDVTTCDFAANLTLITASSDKTIRIWSWTPGVGYQERAESPLKDHKYNVTCVRASPQGFMFASSSVDGTAILWGLDSCRKMYTMTQVNGDAIRVCSFSPNGSLLVTAGDNGAICVWDLVRRSLVRTILEHEGTTQSISFTPDSLYIISACTLEIINVWYVQNLLDTTHQNSCSPSASIDNALDMGILSSDISKLITTDEDDALKKIYTLATSGGTKEIKIWSIISTFTPKSKNSCQSVMIVYKYSFYGHNSSVTCVRFNYAGTNLVSCSLDKLVRLWDLEGNCLAVLQGHMRYVNCVAIAKDMSILASGSAGSNDKQIIIWDLNGDLTIDSDIVKHRIGTSTEEMQLVENTDNIDSMLLMEKLEDATDGAINCCCFGGNIYLAVGAGDKMVRLFKLHENKNFIEEPHSPFEGHTYSVNYLEFSHDGSILASCSQDGCTFLWDPLTGDKIGSFPMSSLSTRVCRFSPDDKFLIIGGDDEKASLWKTDTLELVTVLEGHLETVTHASFTPDGALIATTCFNEDFRVWTMPDFQMIHLEEYVHTTGIQSCDFSPNLEPLLNTPSDEQIYLLGTCGNDNVAKLWKFTVPKPLDFEQIKVKLWKNLYGHGGHLTNIRFSQCLGDIVCTTAIDRQVRLWSVFSGECIYVLEHDSIVTSCSFSDNCSLLAIGCLDKSLWLWKMPLMLVFQTGVVNKLKYLSKNVIDWTTNDVVSWFEGIGLKDIAVNALNTSLNGQKLLTLPIENICSGLDIDDEISEKLSKELKWLRQGNLSSEFFNKNYDDIPDEFLCPITHEIMMEPVVCTDGFTYERRAIVEWFMAGKLTSPMTNERLSSTSFKMNNDIRNKIHDFLDVNMNLEED